MQNATHSFRSEKFLHHCVQRLSKPGKLTWFSKKKNLLGRLFPLFGNFNKKGFFRLFQPKYIRLQRIYPAFMYSESAQKTL
jgi:hypothetical protein